MIRLAVTAIVVLAACTAAPPPPPSPLVGTWKSAEAVEPRDWGYAFVSETWLRMYEDGGFELSTNGGLASQQGAVDLHGEVSGSFDLGPPLVLNVEASVACDTISRFDTPLPRSTCTRSAPGQLVASEWTLDDATGELTIKFDHQLPQPNAPIGTTLGPLRRTTDSGPRPTVVFDQVQGLWFGGAPLEDGFMLSTDGGLTLDAGFPGRLRATLRVGADGALRYRELEQRQGRASLSDLSGTITIDGGIVWTSTLTGNTQVLVELMDGGAPELSTTPATMQEAERFVRVTERSLWISGLPVSSFGR